MQKIVSTEPQAAPGGHTQAPASRLSYLCVIVGHSMQIKSVDLGRSCLRYLGDLPFLLPNNHSDQQVTANAPVELSLWGGPRVQEKQRTLTQT